ncbi:MAG TPA: MATE family efflux transporter [Kofleriaceae bacterium]|nr:MATE family efflux transporter [Kofleriaceae bacterium]
MSWVAPLRPLLLLALPMVLARATQSVMTFADALLVKHLGTDAIAASATGGFNVFLFAILPMGIVFIVQSFVAQLVGRGDAADAPRFAWYGLGISAAAGLLALALIPGIGPALELTDYSPAVRAQMTEYMAIRMYGVAAIVAVEALGNWYGGLGNTWMALVASLISTAVDLFLNWVLIFGNLGAPEMGVNGAALSSTIGSWVGFAFLAVAFYRRWGGAPRGRGRLGLSLRELSRVIRFGLPNGMNWFLEFAAFQLVFVNFVFSGLGDELVAALNVVIAINSVSFMPAFGLASAGAILAGQAIGRGARDAVWPQVKVTLLVTMTWMGAIGVIYIALPVPLMDLFNEGGSKAALVTTGATMLAISAAWQLFDAIGITLSETLRSAGDTFWTAAMRFVLAWILFLPASFYVVFELDGGALGAMACLVGYLALLAGAFAYRFRSGAWRHIELIEPKLV